MEGAGEVVRSYVCPCERTFALRLQPAEQETLVEDHVGYVATGCIPGEVQRKLEEICEPDREQPFGEATCGRPLEMPDEPPRGSDDGRPRKSAAALCPVDLGPEDLLELGELAEDQPRTQKPALTRRSALES
ncbi:MAG: hypothetical protein E6J79_15870 [Deltaproteobacteria bacterium]|nr:MAG: hypothetical protein E6J79_15870 [Deltaproteobacteria bacterium]